MATERRRDWLRYRSSGPGLDWAEAAFVRHRFSPHRHDTYAIGVTTRGVQAFTYRGAARASLVGDAFFLHPDELHDGGPGGEEGLGYRILYIDPALIGAALGGGPLPFVADPVARAREIAAAVDAVFPHPEDPREELREADAICALAAVLAKTAGCPAGPPVAPDPALKQVHDQLTDRCAEGISTSELEGLYGRDRFTLARQFRRIYGVSPSRFVTLRRLDRARRAIADGTPLAEVALAAGFADQAHLTRQFRAAYGTTPGRWRSLLRAA
ncbi:AraC family transcriptional regulator [Pelagibius sp. 7325]|uniref:AraC family transcriptional regulator n=1 Tax=Pelagibius sp. 7325 TaxID=3131994 RepID=UPI0030EBD2A7